MGGTSGCGKHPETPVGFCFGEVGVLLGRFCGCGGWFFLACLGDWVEKFVFLSHRCVTCAVG